MTDTARDTAMPAEIASLVERLAKRAATMNGAVVGASDGATYTLGYYDQFAAADDKEAATALEAQAAELAAVQVSNNKWLAKWERAEAQLAEARKALDAFVNRLPRAAWKLPDGTMVATAGIEIEHFRAARRALTGVKEDG